MQIGSKMATLQEKTQKWTLKTFFLKNPLGFLAFETSSSILTSNRSFWPAPIYRDINFVLKCLPERCVQHSFNIRMGKYSDRFEAEGIVFIPLIVDTFGGWHKDSSEVVSKLGRRVSRQTGKEEEMNVRQLRQRVAILLVRGNVNMYV